MSGFCTGCGEAMDADDLFCAKCGRPREGRKAAQPAQVADAGASGSSTASTSAKKSTGSMVAAAIGVASLGLVPILVMSGGGSCNGDTAGNVVVAGGPRPGFTFTPTGCASMQPYGRFGANLHGEGENDGAVYVTLDPTRGAAVEVEIPGSCRNSNGTDCTVFPLPRDKCRTFEADVEFTGVTVNDVRQVEGHVAVDCALEDGTTVRGRVTFDGC